MLQENTLLFILYIMKRVQLMYRRFLHKIHDKLASKIRPIAPVAEYDPCCYIVAEFDFSALVL